MSDLDGDVREHLEVHATVTVTGVLRRGATVHPGGVLWVMGVMDGTTTVHDGAELRLNGVATGRIVLEQGSSMDVAGVLDATVIDKGGRSIVRVGAMVGGRQVGPDGMFVQGGESMVDADTPAFELLDGGRLGSRVQIPEG